MLRNYLKTIMVLFLIVLLATVSAGACTGIRLLAKNGGVVYGRTMEWGAFDLNSRVAIIPRGYLFKGMTPEGFNGKSFQTKYGIVGLDALDRDYMVEGMNERGLAAGIFYHHNYAIYPNYVKKDSSNTISSLDVVNYILSQFTSVKEVTEGMKKVAVILAPQLPGVTGMSYQYHWMVTDTTGASIVIEFRNHKMLIYNNILGVITNNPYYDWHMTNLRNYINLSGKSFPARKYVNTLPQDTFYLTQLGNGTGMLGLPGDNTPPSRFIRAVAWTQTARPLSSAKEAVYETFRILDNFQLPLGPGAAEGGDGNVNRTKGMRSSTLWTTAWNLTDRTLNYHTQHNRRVRYLDLKKISFISKDKNPKIMHLPLDVVKEQDKDDITQQL